MALNDKSFPRSGNDKSFTRSGNALPPGIRVILLVGEEFQRTERLDEIIGAAVDPATRDFNYDVFYGQDLKKTEDAGRFASMVMEFPMMAERRVVVIRFFDTAEKEIKKKIAGALENVPETTLVLIEGDKVALTPKPQAKFLREETFKPVYEKNLFSWIQGRFRKRGKEASKKAVAILANNIGPQLRELNGEIEKIVMVAGDAPTVTEQDAEKIVGEFRRYTVYALQNAVGTGDFAGAVHILRSLMEEEKGRETYYTVNLASHIMKIAGYHALVKSGVPPDEAKKSVGQTSYLWGLNKMDEQSRAFTEERVRRALDVLAETDSDLKRSRIDKELIMEFVLPRIMP